MGLTGTPVLVVAAALASGLFAATLLLWPRLAGRTARAVAGRTALLLSTQLALFVAAGLLANHSFLFYGSWADLLGREQELGTVTDHGAGKGASGGVVRIGTVRPDAPGAGRRRRAAGSTRSSSPGAPRESTAGPTSICRRSTSSRPTPDGRSPR